MKPVAIFRYAAADGPGYFSTYLRERGLSQQLFTIDAGDVVPTDPRAFAGIGLMGGPMSVNDPLPWIPPMLSLVRSAVDAGIPVIGHCLGGQLMSRALGGTVGANPVWEVGWGEVWPDTGVEARRWFGDVRAFDSFHWHGETFTIPPGAVRIASSEYCPHQAFALGPHLGLQCHVEVTEAIIGEWTSGGANEAALLRGPSVQSVDRIRHDTAVKLPRLRAIAHRLYERWVAGLAR